MNTTFVALFGVEAALKIYAYGFRVRSEWVSKNQSTSFITLPSKSWQSPKSRTKRESLVSYFFWYKRNIFSLEGDSFWSRGSSGARVISSIVCCCCRKMKWVLLALLRLENTMNHMWFILYSLWLVLYFSRKFFLVHYYFLDCVEIISATYKVSILYSPPLLLLLPLCIMYQNVYFGNQFSKYCQPHF